MKKIVISLTTLLLITSCGVTSTNSDMQMLQQKNPDAIVYRINVEQYVVCDSSNVYHVSVSYDGKIKTKIKIK